MNDEQDKPQLEVNPAGVLLWSVVAVLWAAAPPALAMLWGAAW